MQKGNNYHHSWCKPSDELGLFCGQPQDSDRSQHQVSDQYRTFPVMRDRMDVECVNAIAAGLKVKVQTKYQHLQHDTTGYDKIENSSDNGVQINNYKWYKQQLSLCKLKWTEYETDEKPKKNLAAAATSTDPKKGWDVTVTRSATSVPFMLYLHQNISAVHMTIKSIW